MVARRPGCIVLDEPTNHLDASAMEFLEEFLTGLPGVVLLASHDRVFLDRVCTALVDLDPATDGPTRFTGAFSGYLEHPPPWPPRVPHSAAWAWCRRANTPSPWDG
jgi:macrolide transport system ATP-binding/permease protein